MKLPALILIAAFVLESYLQTSLAENSCEDSGFQAIDADNIPDISEGQNVTLQCKFNVPMNCDWDSARYSDPGKYIPVHFDQSSRYHYCDANEGKNAMDCSIYILTYKKSRDEMHWRCRPSPADSAKHPSVSKEERIFMLSNVVTVNQDLPDSSSVMSIPGEPSEPELSVTSPTHPSELVSEATHAESMTNADHLENMGSSSTSMQLHNSNFHTSGSTATVPMQLEFVEHPVNATINAGENVVLKCVFNAKVKCQWKRQGNPTTIGERYHYSDGSTETTAEDCSLSILNAEERDSGEWECSAVDHSSGISPKDLSSKAWLEVHQSAEISLTIPIQLEIMEHPVNATVSFGGNITLKCVFNTKVECQWERNGHLTAIGGRYLYSDGSTKATAEDCSLSIRTAEEMDNGTWNCVARDPSFEEIPRLVSSNEAWLEVKQMKAQNMQEGFTEILEQPQNATVDSLQGEVTLQCVFNKQVDCVWKKDGVGKAVMNRYRFKDDREGRNTTDCSITINSPRTRDDEGSWTCSSTDSGIESNAAWLHLITIPDVEATTKHQTSKLQNEVSNKSNLEEASANAATTSSNAATIAIVCVMLSIGAIAVVVFLTLYKKKKYFFAPKRTDSDVEPEMRLKVSESPANPEAETLLKNNGTPREKLKESDSSNV